MALVLRSLHFLILLYASYIPLALAQGENGFIYNGFHDQANLGLDGIAEIHPNGLLQLTNLSRNEVGRAFYQFPFKFDPNSSLSFSTNFVFAMVPEVDNLGGHGIAFTISPSRDFTHAEANRFLGLFNDSNNGNTANHILAIEVDPVPGPDFGDIKNHVGIDVNSIDSDELAPTKYFSNEEGKNISLELLSGNPMHLWIDYDEAEKLLTVTLAPTTIPKPNRPLLSTTIDLSKILLESMYVGFSSATGTVTSYQYILGWSFNKSGPAQSLDVSSLPPLPERKGNEKAGLVTMTSLIAAAVVLITVAGVAAYILRRKKYEELQEDWEEEYGPHRFSFQRHRGYWRRRFWKGLYGNTSFV
jgi:hypothetical protein